MFTSTRGMDDKDPSGSRLYRRRDAATRLAVCTAVTCAVLAISLPIITCLIVRENDKVFDAWWYQYGGGLVVSLQLIVIAIVMSVIAANDVKGQVKKASKTAIYTCFFCVAETMGISLVKIAGLICNGDTDAWWFKYGCAAWMTFIFAFIAIVSSVIVAYNVIASREAKERDDGNGEKPEGENT